MPLKFSGKARIDEGTGDVLVSAYVGDVPITCTIKRSAMTAGFNGLGVSDAQALEVYYIRSDEIHAIASQRFDNGERAPTLTRCDRDII
jgi:hypothetical protein